jgi:hypothetical protein
MANLANCASVAQVTAIVSAFQADAGIIGCDQHAIAHLSPTGMSSLSSANSETRFYNAGALAVPASAATR